jgi:hypothetical protein
MRGCGVVIVAPSPGADIAPTSLATPRAQHAPVNAQLQQIFDSDPMAQTKRMGNVVADRFFRESSRRAPPGFPSRAGKTGEQPKRVSYSASSLTFARCRHIACHARTTTTGMEQHHVTNKPAFARSPGASWSRTGVMLNYFILHTRAQSADLARYSLIVPSGHHPRSARVQSPIAHHR